MADERVLEGLALRRKVAAAQGWRMEQTDKAWMVYDSSGDLYRVYFVDWYDIKSADEVWDKALSEPDAGIPAYDTDLNTIKDAAAMLPDTHKLEVRWYPDETIAIVDVVGSISWKVNRIAVSHTEPATAAWNAVLRWLARKQEAGNE